LFYRFRLVGQATLNVPVDAAKVGLELARAVVFALHLLGLGVAVDLGQRLRRLARVALAQRDVVALVQLSQIRDAAGVELGIGRVGDGLLLERGIDADPSRLWRLSTPCSLATATAWASNSSAPSSPMRWRRRVSEDGSIGSSCWKYSSPQKYW